MFLYLITGVFIWLAYNYITYWQKKTNLPGPVFPIPFIGSGLRLIKDANRYWLNQATLGPVSADMVFGQLIVFIRDNALSKQIFLNQNTGYFRIVADPFNTGLFAEGNLMHMDGNRHKFFRQQFTPLFTAQKLDAYFFSQKEIVLKHMNLWNELKGQSQDFKILNRNLNLETSQKVLIGNYGNEEEINILNHTFPIFNDSLFAIPINYPGSQLSKGFQALATIRHTLEGIVTKVLDYWETIPVENIQQEQEKRQQEHNTCMLDWWISNLYLEQKTRAQILKLVPLEELAHHTFDQLYASQDASVSSLSWCMALLAMHGHVKKKVRIEILNFLQKTGIITNITNDFEITNTLLKANWFPSNKDLHELPYLDNVVKEILRYRPPAPLLTHLTLQNYKLVDGETTYTIPKGALVFPSIYESGFQGFTNPDQFDPDRFSKDRGEGKKHKDKYIPFGIGPHLCIGKFGWERDTNFKCADPNGDIITYGPTTFPINTNFM